MVYHKSKTESDGNDGVKILKNEPFENEERGKGQYTEKIYYINANIPSFTKTLFPSLRSLTATESSYNCFPTCFTEYKLSEPLEDTLTFNVRSVHLDDNGSSDPVKIFDLTPKQQKSLEVYELDIFKLSSNKKNNLEVLPCDFESVKTGRSKLTADWINTHSPVMCCYKLFTVNFKWFGLQTIGEKLFMDYAKDITYLGHCEIFLLIDKWFDLTIEDIRRLEKELQNELDQKMKDVHEKMLKES